MTVPPGVKGTLHLCGEAEQRASGESACSHVSVFTNDRERRRLEDNDIRGFLDGRFNWGWNQPGQGHVRVGRVRSRIQPPRYGEEELFRTLQRWAGIDLPSGAGVQGARLSLRAETPIEGSRTFYLYAMRRDWAPGTGGVREDNVSVPAEGEVWWCDARYGREEWGLPGAGFAGGTHPEADTDPSPLAVARCGDGDRLIELEGEGLARYVKRRLERDRPLLFLLKLSDREEDVPGSVVDILSGEYGDDRNPGFRPRLRIEWTPPPGWSCRTEEVFLEYGRRRTLDPVGIPDAARLWVSFATEDGFEAPTILRRDRSAGREEEVSRGRPVTGPVVQGSDEIELELLAARDPVALGDPYVAELHDTWVVTAPPEDQRLVWRFSSPSGVSHEVLATYQGDFFWTAEFVPDEIGRWTVQWRHEFWGPPRAGPEATFDVIPGGLEEVCRGLRRLARRANSERESDDFDLASNLQSLLRLERAGMSLLTPGSFRSEEGHRLRAAVDRARESLWGESMPEGMPMESHPLRYGTGDRRFREPIPKNRHFRTGADEELRGWDAVLAFVRSWGRRLSRRLTRLLRRRNAGGM